MRMNKMGFGFLRLPKIGEEIDYAQLNQMTDAFLAAGGTYFDTAILSKVKCAKPLHFRKVYISGWHE